MVDLVAVTLMVFAEVVVVNEMMVNLVMMVAVVVVVAEAVVGFVVVMDSGGRRCAGCDWGGRCGYVSRCDGCRGGRCGL